MRLIKKIKRCFVPDCGHRRKGLAASFNLGAAVYLLEYVFCTVYTTSFSIMGVQAQKIEDYVFSQFKGMIFLYQLKILGAYAVIGGLTGLAVGYLLYAWSALRGRPVRPRCAAAVIALFALSVSVIFLVHDIIMHPALYNEHFYARGAAGKALQIFITDTLPPALTGGIKTALLLVFIPAVGAFLYYLASKIVPVLKCSGRIAAAAAGGLAIVIMSVAGNRNEGPNIIIIAADSFRYDRVSALGGRPGLTPHVDALLREGVSFDDLHVQLPRTFPSWYTLLSGRFPAQHGIRNMFPRKEEMERARLYLPEILKKNGYAVTAVADYAGDIFSRMKCFERVDAPKFNFLTMIRQRGLEIHFLLLPYLQNGPGRAVFPEMLAFAQNSDPEFLTGAVEDELSRLSGEKKFFLSVFCSVSHFPYAAPHPYYKRFTQDGYRGDYRYLKINDPTKSSLVTDEDKKQVTGLFDGACSAVDDALGGIIAGLKKRGLYDNSIIIFTADHGENLYDDGLDLGHGEHFRGEYATHVPMIIKFHKDVASNVTTRRLGGTALQVDLAPTLLDVLNIESDAEFAGISYKKIIEGKTRQESRIAYAETGIWFVDSGDQFFQRQRIRYPDVSVLCRIDTPGYDIVLKNEYDGLINIAKHRTVFDEKYKVIYIPTREGVRYEMYRRGDKTYTNLYEPGNPEFRRLYAHLKNLVLRHEKARIINEMFIP